MELISLRKARGRRGISTTDVALAYEILGVVSVILGMIEKASCVSSRSMEHRVIGQDLPNKPINPIPVRITNSLILRSVSWYRNQVWEIPPRSDNQITCTPTI